MVEPSEHSPPENTPQPKEKRVWRTGTLIYSSAGLLGLFACLLLGDFAWSMRDRSVGPMASWYLDHLGVSSLIFGLLLSSFPALISLFLSPVVSYKSDRHRGKWGRRIPFLLATTPLSAVSMIGLGLTPLLAKKVHALFPDQSEVFVAVTCFAIFWAVFELASIASMAVFGALINDVVPKELLGRFYGLFRAISLLDGIIFNYWIMGHVPAHYTLIFILVGTFYGVAFMWVCGKVKEGEYPPPPQLKAMGMGHGFIRGARTYFGECFTRPYYIALFVFANLAGLAFLPINTFSIPYALSLGIEMALYGKCMAMTFVISLVLSFFLGWLADLFHPLRMAMVFLFLYLGVSVFGALTASTKDTFLVAWILHIVVSGCYFTSAASLGARLYPQSKFAQFASAAGIIGNLGCIALSPLVGSLLDVTGKMYRLTFGVGALLAFIGLAVSVRVYRDFIRFGGIRNYTAPE
jgi:MFS family permease